MVKNKNIDILAVILDVGLTLDNSAVFQSQVMDQLIALKNIGYKVGILCVYSDEEIFINDIAKQFKENDIAVFYKKDRGLIKNMLFMIKTIKIFKNKISISNAYVRGIWGALCLILANPISTVPYVYDLRGDMLDEMKASGTGFLKSSIYIFLEKLAILYAQNLSAVSSVLKNIICKRIWTSKDIYIIPSCINFTKFQITDEEILSKKIQLNILNEDIVLLYSGGLSHYQKVPEMIELWRRLHAENIGIKFILLTNSDPHSLPSEIPSLDSFGPSLQIFNLSRSEVFAMLGIADLAFLLRDDRNLNKAASPVKFAEYIASGAAVIGSPNTGDTSKHILDNNIGLLISPSDLDKKYNDLLNFINLFRSEKKSISMRSTNLAVKYYDWKSYKKTFNEIYGLPNSLSNKG